MKDASPGEHNDEGMDVVCRFAGHLAHEFNNLLTPIVACGQMLEESPSAEDVAFCAEQINDAGNRIQALTKKLQLIGSRRSGSGVAPVVELVSSAVQSIKSSSPASLTFAEPYRENPQLASLSAAIDPGQFTFVITELLRNAAEAMSSGGELRVDLESLAGTNQIRLTVSDRGYGMNIETTARIFEPFFTTRSQARDRGLGLTIVYGIVRRAGGSIVCQSEPGRGTAMTVMLPQAKSAT